MPDTHHTLAADGSTGGLAGLTDRQTYKNLAYLALAFPLGLVYFVVLTVGIALGLGLSVILVGLPLLGAVLFGIPRLAAFERSLANALLDVSLTAPPAVSVSREAGLWETVRAHLTTESTWRGLAFCYLKLGMGMVALVLLALLISLPIALITAPLHYDVSTVSLGVWEVTTFAESLLVVPLGIGIGIVGLRILNATARKFASIAESLLDGAA